jgi:hypothetical protein
MSGCLRSIEYGSNRSHIGDFAGEKTMGMAWRSGDSREIRLGV